MLKDAADYIMKLPKKESDLPEWQTAIEVLMLCSRGGHAMMARIGVKALNRNVERVFNPDRKETHWGNANSRGTGCDLVHISGIKKTDSVEVVTVQIKQRG